MSKKGYQKRLPVVLPPTARPPSRPPALPAPRRSPESVEPTRVVPIPVIAPAPPALAPAPAPAPTSDRPRRSRASVIGIAAVALVNVAAAGFLVFVITDDPASTRSASTPAGDRAADPPRILAGRESYVETQALPNGDLEVHQWIRAREPLSQLRLALPKVPGAADLAATGIEVLAEGEPVVGPTSISARPVTYAFDETLNLEVSYVLTGAVQRSASAEGRALAVATTLDVIYAPLAEQETRVVRATEVLSLACSPSLQEPATPCGEDDGDGQWRVELSGAGVDDRVTAALTIG